MYVAAEEKLKLFTPPQARWRGVPCFRHTCSGGLEVIEVRDVCGQRRIEGVASTGFITKKVIVKRSQGIEWEEIYRQSLQPRGCMAKLPIPLKSEHANYSEIGAIYYLRKSATNIYIRAVLHDGPAADHTWDLIRRGLCRGLSVGPGAMARPTVADSVHFFSRWWINEISVCRRPANPECHFEILR